VAAGELAHLRDAFLAALGNDVGGAELVAQVGAGLVTAHQDNLLRAETLGREHCHQPDGAVTDHGDPLAGGDSGGVGSVVAGAEDIGERQQGRDERRVGRDRQLHQGAVGERNTNRLGFTALVGYAVPEGRFGVGAGGVQPHAAELAGVVGDRERGDDQVALLDGGDLRADLFDDADELVPHPGGAVAGTHRVVGMQVAAADAGGGDAHQGVGGLLDLAVGDVLDADIACLVHQCCAHE